MYNDRSKRIQELAKLIAEVKIDHPVRVGIDGFHNPAEVRRRRGANSPKGYDMVDRRLKICKKWWFFVLRDA